MLGICIKRLELYIILSNIKETMQVLTIKINSLRVYTFIGNDYWNSQIFTQIPMTVHLQSWNLFWNSKEFLKIPIGVFTDSQVFPEIPRFFFFANLHVWQKIGIPRNSQVSGN